MPRPRNDENKVERKATTRMFRQNGFQQVCDNLGFGSIRLKGKRADTPWEIDFRLFVVSVARENCWRILEGQNGQVYNVLQLHMLGSFLAQLEVVMSLKPALIPPVPVETARIAQAAFPQGNPYLMLRDELRVIFTDADFAHLYLEVGQPSLPPWQLALVTVLQFRENLSDQQAAGAVRARIDWKYLLGLELTAAGFDFSVLSEFRARLLAGGSEAILLDKLLVCCRERGLVKARGKQRTDATRVLAAIRVLNRLELVAETLRSALNALATEAPLWLQRVAPQAWYQRYGRRIEDDRLPEKPAERDTYARTVGEDGYYLLDLLGGPNLPIGLKELPAVQILRQVWQRHYRRKVDEQTGKDEVQLTPKEELGPAAGAIESPYDIEARFRSRYATSWTGYMVHLVSLLRH